MTIVGGVLTTSLIFGLAAFGIAYSMEDRLFRGALADEVAHQTYSWQHTGSLKAPKNPSVIIYRGIQSLPSDIRNEFVEGDKQAEFSGLEGRHYHVQRFNLNEGRSGAGPAPAVAVIEVSQRLFVRPNRDSIIKQLVVIGLFIAVTMAIFGWWLVNRAMKPLSDLARDVASAGSGIPVIDPSHYPANEIGVLAEALEQALGRIRGFVEREQAFTRDASHELRTPLSVVSGAAEVIALNRNLPSHVAEPLRRIQTATKDMKLALDQLLALARENVGVLKESVALKPMIDKAVSWSEFRYPNGAIVVSTGIDDSAVVSVHPTSLQLVLNNLIGNCFQHVGTGHLVVNFEGGCLLISDDGPGFETDNDPFAPFAKGRTSIGSGLGLDISRRLCDAAGISMTARESAVGRGTEFRLKFGQL